MPIYLEAKHCVVGLMSYVFGSDSIGRGGRFKAIQQSQDNPQRIIHRGVHKFFAGPGDPEGYFFEGGKLLNGIRNDGGNQQAIIDLMRDNGGNALYVMSNRWPGDGTPDQTCWPDGNFNLPVVPAIMSQWHGWLRQLEEIGVVVMFFIWDDQGTGRDNPYSSGSNAPVPAGEDSYFGQLMDEFSRYENVIWVIGEEVEKEYSNARLSNQGASMRGHSDEALIGIHQVNGNVFQLPTDQNVKFFAIQLNNLTESQLYDSIVSIWSDAVANGYCYALTEVGDPPAPRGAAARRIGWISLLAGCCGYSLLEMQLQTITEQEYIDELHDLQRLVDFCDSSLWYEMAPNDADIVAGVEHLMSGNDHYIAWSPSYSASFQISNMSAGVYTIRWQSCNNNNVDEAFGVSIPAGINTFEKPAAISSECALYIERTA